MKHTWKQNEIGLLRQHYDSLTSLGPYGRMSESKSASPAPFNGAKASEMARPPHVSGLSTMNSGCSCVLISLINSTDNLGLKYVHAALLRQGYQSHILFYIAEDDSYCEAVGNFVKELRPRVVGISVMSRFFHMAAALTDAIRRKCGPNITIVWGGIHPTIDPEGCRQHADYICRGEGEMVFVDFLENLDGTTLKKEIPGLSSAKAFNISSSAVIEDLNSLAPPQHLPRNSWVTDGGRLKPLNSSLFKKHNRHYGAYLSVMTSRGCPFSCSYCCNNLLHEIYGKQIRKRSPESVLEEIEQYLVESDLRFSYLSILDDCFTAHSVEWLEEFIKGYKEISIPLVFRSIPQFVTEEKIALLRQAPCGFALIGLQSGSERTLRDVYQRKHSRSAFLRCAELLDKSQIPAVYDLIVDNPYETADDHMQTVGVVAKLPKSSYVSLASLTFYKYTALYERAKADGLNVDQHLSKNQDQWNKRSKEVRAIKLAALLNEKIAQRTLMSHSPIEEARLRLIAAMITKLWEPFRYLKLMYLSHGRKALPFMRLLYLHARDFGKRYFSPARLNKHPH
jgi:anaerobic magnesium-protoporphyrin IX monomethyl ester cyclase